MEFENLNYKTNFRIFQMSKDDAFDACCGKILITRKQVLVIRCSFCKNNFSCFDDFVEHLTTQHYQHTQDENVYADGNDTKVEFKVLCSSFDGSKEQDDEKAEFSEIQSFAEVVIKPDFKEVQEEYFEEIEEVIINNGEYCEEKQFDTKLKSSDIREELDEMIETDVDLNMEDIIVDDFDVYKHINKTVDDSDVQTIHDKENYNMDKFYRQYQFKDKEQPLRGQEYRKKKYKKTVPEEVFKCNICDKKFPYKDRLKKHSIIHSEERKHKCHLCNFAFKDSSNLRAHMTRHTMQKNISCDICSKKFFTRSEAKQHKRLHTGERPFICTTCGLAFISSGAMTVHAKRHYSEPLFKCNHCEKGFYGRADFQDHMLVHTKEKLHVCHICGASFPRRKSMLRHTKLHSK